MYGVYLNKNKPSLICVFRQFNKQFILQEKRYH